MNLGVSSCLLGYMCRYDGATSKDRYIMDELSKYFNLIPYCPEEDVFGTPRESISLKEFDDKIKVFTNFTKIDVTQKLQNSVDNIVDKIKEDNLCGYILKSKSPSCGMERVKVYDGLNTTCEKKGVGLFAKNLKEYFPHLPIEEDGRLIDPWLKENFLMQVFAYKDLIEFLDKKPSMKDLVEFHTDYKYLIYAKSQESYKTLGQIVGNQAKISLESVLLNYKNHFLKAISLKSNRSKTYNVLLHIFGYFKKELTKMEKELILSSFEEYKDGLIPLIAVTKTINLLVVRFEQEYLKTQKFLHPYPKELSLRSDVKAYK
ncbi:MAG: DUF523 and DUF1722 domain-containing protein [Campylobacterota bacterium]|nr:DUF523 and DUF1722 domain-containing protein [Campylobacterota bacterium]